MEKNKQTMSSCDIIVPSMTEEQEKLLKFLEETFKDRYTENDEGFQETLHKKLPPPPLMDNWIRPHDGRHWRNNRNEDRGSSTHRHGYSNYECYRGYKRDDDDDDQYQRGDRRGQFSYSHNRHRYEPY